ncbi:hypothetical protein [uncultured Methanobrevibacter sp.]|uniref:hypothetical protein n=1 Tax=uncultured Methanobrevibacter sp. TaxID=253161 RepID=UPI0025D11D05|nr:hypothetical protein [uncultured Methanobrevibacter sp.]
MVLCPVCNKENNNEEYCTVCGTKLDNVKKDPIFEFDKNKDISNVNELNIYLKELNKKINQQEKYLDELNNDPLMKKYESISKVNDENNELRTKIKELEHDKEETSLKLKKHKKMNIKLKAEIEELRTGNGVVGAIKGIFGNNKAKNEKPNFCPNCGHKLS